MAEVKRAKVIKVQHWQPDVCHLTCAVMDSGVLEFKGGQYIIINSGKLLANGKLGKRAYSILSPDSQQDCFELAIKKIPDGVAGSHFMHALLPGDTFEFSGPWGQYHSGHLMADNERVLGIATDTGITAALGLWRSQAMAPFLNTSKLLWFISDANYFIPMDCAGVKSVVFCPTVGDETRASFIAKQVFETMAQERFTKIYLSGDGLVIKELKERLSMPETGSPQIFSESFFHHESLKTAASR